ncbi:MAG: hypothetical protein K5987_00990 [Lachnospiraceae bacterium]|nr:hypothetical protein [Lachnospiraceae bacterium]
MTSPRAKAADVIVKIDAIPAAITWENEDDVDSAWGAYNELSDDQKALISEASVNKLMNYEAALDVAVLISFLPNAADVTSTDADKIPVAREKYEALTAAQKALVDNTVTTKLSSCEDKLVETIAAEINGVTEITEVNKGNVKELLESYDKLTDTEKDAVDRKIGRKGTKKSFGS